MNIINFVCFGQIIFELKAISELTEDNLAQTLNYLQGTKLEEAFLINFGERSLKYKRVAL